MPRPSEFGQDPSKPRRAQKWQEILWLWPASVRCAGFPPVREAPVSAMATGAATASQIAWEDASQCFLNGYYGSGKQQSKRNLPWFPAKLAENVNNSPEFMVSRWGITEVTSFRAVNRHRIGSIG